MLPAISFVNIWIFISSLVRDQTPSARGSINISPAVPVPSSAFSLSSWLLLSGGKMEAFFYCWVPVIDGSWDQICLVEHLKKEKSNLANNHLRILHRAKVLTDGFRKGHLHKIYTQNINTLELGVFCRALLGKCATSLCPLWVGQPSHRLCRDSR